MDLAIISITEYGKKLGEYIQGKLGGHLFIPHKLRSIDRDCLFYYKDSLKELILHIWDRYHAFIFIMPVGIVVRIIKDHIKDKYKDPAVVVVDELGRYAISLLSGHEGGANRLAQEVALVCEGDFVVTTGTESTKRLVAGMGCRRGISEYILEKALREGLGRINRSLDEVRLIVSVEDKKNEDGFYKLSQRLNIPLKFISKDLIKVVENGFARSQTVKKAIGVYSVAEPCAILGGHRCRIILPRISLNGVTVAIGEERSLW